MSRIRNVALLLLVLVLATGLASAQQGIKVTQVTASGPVSLPSFNPGSVASRAPVVGKYWDAQPATDYYNVPQYINAPPNPQIAVGPDDILTIVNRVIYRYPNPNAPPLPGQAPNTVANPYNNTPSSKIYLDTWLGVTDLNLVCPTVAPQRSNLTCVIDNATIRYDQMQGRFVVLMTVTDVPSHISNFVLIVSSYAVFTQGTSGTSQLFTAAPIAPVVGGVGTGGVSGSSGARPNWTRYIIPINVTLPATVTANTGFCVSPKLGGDPGSQPLINAAGSGPITSGCSDYFPTGARIGLDNDNIIMTAPVLDMSFAPLVPVIVPTAVPNMMQLPGGPYAGTRVVSIAKLYVYNGTGGSDSAAPSSAYNLTDDTQTGTLTGTNTNPAAGPATAGIGVTAAGSTSIFAKWCGPAGSTATGCNPIPPIFWEPDNLRGRALASFDSQVYPSSTDPLAGILAPMDFLVGTLISDNFGATTNADFRLYVQPIIFTCASGIYKGPSGVSFCGAIGGGSSAPAQVAEVPVLGVQFGTTANATQLPRNNVQSIAITGDPALVGQADVSTTGSLPAGFNTGCNDTGTTIGTCRRLFVGDSRPQQVIFREGLLYVARAVRLYESGVNALGTSTVMYNILKQPGATCTGVNTTLVPNCGLTIPVTFSPIGATIPAASLVMETEWFNGNNTYDPTSNATGYGFYAPMYDTPANVISSVPTSPISVFPWLEKLFVGMTTGGTPNVAATFNRNFASLWDFRPGDDVYDTSMQYIDPYTGAIIATRPCVPGGTRLCPIVPFGTRGGGATDPNDGSLWLYGAFAKSRIGGVPGAGSWGTSVANYQLDFPTVDPYNNDNSFFTDVQPGNPYFTWIQIAKNLGIYTGLTTATSGTVCVPNNNPANNPPILQPPSPGGTTDPGTGQLTCTAFGPDVTVTRSEMARWIILGQMDDAQVNAYLAATGGIPGCSGLSTTTTPALNSNTCANAGDWHASSFGDPPSTAYPTGVLNDKNLRYIETMYRRGYTKGCSTTDDPVRRYCGGDFVNRAQLAVFLIRAKMNNVFPTSLSGISIGGTGSSTVPYGDNFGLHTPTTPYFTDITATDPAWGDYYIYVQKMRELRIANGSGATGQLYLPGNPLTRKEIAVFVVRAFFL